MRSRFLAGALVIVALVQILPAMNGKSMVVANRSIVMYTIAGDAVTGSTAIIQNDSIVSNPRFSIDGQRIVFSHLKQGSTWLAIVNTDGTNLRDIVRVNAQLGYWGGNDGLAQCEWPKGNWVYYLRQTGSNNQTDRTGEVWRVNITDTTHHHMVVDYTFHNSGSDWTRGWSCGVNGWQMSSDGQKAIAHSMSFWKGEEGGNGIFGHLFPPVNPDPLINRIDPNLSGYYFNGGGVCNPGLSASGKFLYHFTGGSHAHLSCYRWDGVSDTSMRMTIGTGESGDLDLFRDVEQWLGQQTGPNFDHPVGCRNSDKWVSISYENDPPLPNKGGGQLLVNWKDKKAIRTATDARATADMWVDGGQANWGKIEDINGNWIDIDSLGAYCDVRATGTNPYQVTMSAQSLGADIRYTTNGSEPTQSSTRYTGPFSLTVPSKDQRVPLKVKAFQSAIAASRTVAKWFMPSGGAGIDLTVQLWRNLQGTAVSDLISSSRYPNSPDTSWSGNLQWEINKPISDGYSNYGVRVCGYIVPPLTGAYKFRWSAGWQVPEFSLRLGASAATSSAIELANKQSLHAWDGTQGRNIGTTSSVTLTAGNYYYVEFLYKSPVNTNWATDDFYIQWQTPWGAWEDPIPRSRLYPLGATPTRETRPPVRSGMTAAPAQPVNVSVYDALGHFLTNVTNASSMNTRLPPGIYFAKYRNATRTDVRRMVIGRSHERGEAIRPEREVNSANVQSNH